MAALKAAAVEGADITDTAGKQFTADAPSSYSGLHNLVKGDGIGACAQCHAPGRPASLAAEQAFLGPQRPYFAVDDIEASYDVIKTKIDVNVATNSRIYDRLSRERHQCWTDNCAADAAVIETQINALLAGLDEVRPSDDLVAVASRVLEIGGDGILLNNQGARADDNAIALWEFKRPDDGSNTAINTSTSSVKVNANLRFTDDDEIEWWGAGGVTINQGRLSATVDESAAIANAIREAGEFSIEAWVIPQNVTQGGDAKPASIVSFSRQLDDRFFMLSQREYFYDFYNRNTLPDQPTDAGGLPILATPVGDEIAQASLQHVVVTFSEVDGRRIYVNGELIVEENDPALAGTFDEWLGRYVLSVGNEIAGGINIDDDSYRQWKGAVRLLAIHNTALKIDDINANYEVGVGEKYYLTFSIGHLVDNLDELYLVFRVEEFDNHSYLFSEPLFYTKNGEVVITDLPIKGVNIGINGREVTSGQAFAKVDTDIDSTSDNYIFDFVVDADGERGMAIIENGGMQRLSRIGTLIPQEKGLNEDQFFVYFNEIGDRTYTPAPPVFTLQDPAFNDEEQSDIGLKNFGEINASLAALTGISEADDRLVNSDLVPLFEVVQQQMPSSENISGFVSANHMGVAQLAFKYCDALVDDRGNSVVDFGGFNFGEARATAFNSNAKKDLIIAPLLANLLADDSANHAPDQPEAGNFGEGGTRDILASLIDELVENGSASTPSVVKATCAAAYSSALMLIQ